MKYTNALSVLLVRRLFPRSDCQRRYLPINLPDRRRKKNYSGENATCRPPRNLLSSRKGDQKEEERKRKKEDKAQRMKVER